MRQHHSHYDDKHGPILAKDHRVRVIPLSQGEMLFRGLTGTSADVWGRMTRSTYIAEQMKKLWRNTMICRANMLDIYKL